MEFKPPIEERETSDLIIIRFSSTLDWQQEAIDLAKNELQNRGIDEEKAKELHNGIQKEFAEFQEAVLDERKVAEFSTGEKVWIVFTWPKELMRNWNLRRDGYEIKAKQRLIYIAVGILFYALLISVLLIDGQMRSDRLEQEYIENNN